MVLPLYKSKSNGHTRTYISNPAPLGGRSVSCHSSLCWKYTANKTGRKIALFFGPWRLSWAGARAIYCSSILRGGSGTRRRVWPLWTQRRLSRSPPSSASAIPRCCVTQKIFSEGFLPSLSLPHTTTTTSKPTFTSSLPLANSSALTLPFLVCQQLTERC